jgi:hypothetical protein
MESNRRNRKRKAQSEEEKVRSSLKLIKNRSVIIDKHLQKAQ